MLTNLFLSWRHLFMPGLFLCVCSMVQRSSDRMGKGEVGNRERSDSERQTCVQAKASTATADTRGTGSGVTYPKAFR